MAFDYKKEYREFYLPSKKPQLVEIPKMKYIAVRWKGNPNEEGGAYKESIGLLYGIAFTIKMSKKSSHEIQGYFDYVVPPLEGFWQQEGIEGIDYERKEKFQWISVIRLPDFVKKQDFDWAVQEAERKKKQDFSKVEFVTVEEGLWMLFSEKMDMKMIFPMAGCIMKSISRMPGASRRKSGGR